MVWIPRDEEPGGPAETGELTKPSFAAPAATAVTTPPAAPDIELSTERALSIPVPELDARASLTVLAGDRAGRVFPLPRGAALLGRSSTAQLRFDDPTISRCHAQVIAEADGYVVEDLGSMNGTFLHGVRVERARLASGDRFQLGPLTVVRFAMADKLERDLLGGLVESSMRDPLTGAFNRRFFEPRLDAEIAYARRHGTQVAVLLIDIDHFKRVNDANGHTGGDQVLRAVASAVRATLRVEDLLGRFGGEEFVVVARAAAQLDPVRLAQRVRIAVESLSVWLAPGKSVGVTVSIGVAQHQECAEPCTAEALIKLADARLYRAKASGRNRICDDGG